MKRICGKLLIALFIIVPCLIVSLNFNKVEAEENPFTVENIIQTNLSNDVYSNVDEAENELKNTVVFHKVNDTATYTIRIRNNSDKEYIIDSIKDTNNNSYVTYVYNNYEEIKVAAKSFVDLDVKAIYEKPVNDTNNREQNIDSTLSINYTEASKIATVSRMEYFNQVLIITFVVLSAIVALIIMYLIQNNKLNNRTKLVEKTTFAVVLLGAIFIPYMVKALGIPFTITLSSKYYLNDQLVVEIDNAKKIVTYKGNLKDVPVEYKRGYTFIGWKTEDGNLIKPSTEITEDLKLTSAYVANKYNINYDLDGGVVDKHLTFTYTINDRVVVNNPVKEGYVFTGWTGTGIDTNRMNVVIPVGSIGTRSLVAHYIPRTYEITYDYNGGDEVDNPTTYTIEDEIILNTPFKTGYTFTKWMDNNVELVNNQINKGTIGNKEYKAIYTPNTYVVKFDKNDEEAEGSLYTQYLTYDNEKELLANKYIKEGYRFVEWNTEKDGSGISYSNEAVVSNLVTEGEITLYAKWERLLVGTFKTGKEVNAAMKKLTGSTSSTYNSNDSKIKYIKRSYELPTNYIEVSSTDSDKPIYMWYKDNTIYFYTESEKVYLNKDSSYFFNKLQSLKEIELDTFNSYKVENFSYMFSNLKQIINLDLNNFKTKNATNMEGMFKDSTNIETLNISSFNTSKVTTMNSMFWGLNKLTSINVSNFNTSNVEDMYALFYSLNTITELNVSNFNTSKVKNMSSMFGNLFNVKTLDLSNFDTSNVTKMENMFNGSKGLESIDLSSFDTRNVVSMMRMFSSTKSIKELDISSFNTNKVTNMTKMFDNMDSLITIYVSDDFVVSNKTTASRMFANDVNLVGSNGTIYDETKINREYAKVDERIRPGYFTRKEETTE